MLLADERQVRQKCGSGLVADSSQWTERTLHTTSNLDSANIASCPSWRPAPRATSTWSAASWAEESQAKPARCGWASAGRWTWSTLTCASRWRRPACWPATPDEWSARSQARRKLESNINGSSASVVVVLSSFIHTYIHTYIHPLNEWIINEIESLFLRDQVVSLSETAGFFWFLCQRVCFKRAKNTFRYLMIFINVS